MAQWINKFLINVKPSVKPRTYQYYEMMAKTHLLSSPLAKIKLKDLRGTVIQEYFNTLLDKPTANNPGKTLAFGTINSIRRTLSIIVETAVNEGLIPRNPVKNTKPIKVEPKEPLALKKADMNKLLDIAFNDPSYIYIDVEKSIASNEVIYYSYRWEEDIGMKYLRHQYALLVLMAIRTMARKGEIAGARWQDINFEKKTFTVVQNLQYGAHGPIIGTPKTYSSRRVILLDNDTIQHLKKWKDEQKNYAKTLGNKYKNRDGYIFTNSFGNFVDLGTFRTNYWLKMCIKAGIQGTRFHDLRHYAASMLLAAGVPIPVVQQRGGWTNPNILLSIYAYTIPGMQQLAVEAIEKLNNAPKSP